MSEYSDYIKRYYDNVASEFGASYHDERWTKDILRRRDFEQTLKSLLYHLGNRRFDRGLEIGCGVGTWSPYFSGICDDFTILDISSNMAKIASDKLYRLGFCNVRRVVGDFQDPKVMVEGHYDVIFSVRAIEYMQNKSYVLSKIRGLLKEGGIALIVTKNPNVGVIPFAFLLTRRIAKPSKLFSHVVHYRDLLVMAKSVGFENISAYPVITGYRIPILNEARERVLSDRLHRMLYRKRINPLYLSFIESYIVIMKRSRD